MASMLGVRGLVTQGGRKVIGRVEIWDQGAVFFVGHGQRVGKKHWRTVRVPQSELGVVGKVSRHLHSLQAFN